MTERTPNLPSASAGPGAGRWLRWTGLVLVLILAAVLVVYRAAAREDLVLDDETRGRAGGAYVPLSKGVTHYRWDGPAGGPTVLMLHGGTIPSFVLDELVPPVAAAGFRVLRFDRYGLGLSDRPAGGAYDRLMFRRQILDLLDRLQLARVDLVGSSMGGALAVDFTAHYPDRVRRLTLLAPVVNSVPIRMVTALRLPAIGPFLTRTVAMRYFVERGLAELAGRPDEARRTKLFLDQFRYRGSEAAALALARGDALGDYRREYRAVGTRPRPILLIWGTADVVVTPEAMAEARRLLPRAESHALDGAAHDEAAAASPEIGRLLAAFLLREDPVK
jgi:pimeloyl-ACP methyl ester carboxylesterase